MDTTAHEVAPINVEDAAQATDLAETAETTETVTQAADDAQPFDRDYVAGLRAEAAEGRVKAKRFDAANERLARAYASADGRLVDVEALTLSDDMLDADGIVDRDRVLAAVEELVTSRPYLLSRRPVSPLPQGARPEAPEQPGLLSIYRQRLL